MTPERLAEIKMMLAKTFPCPSDMIQAREAAKELVAEVERLNRAFAIPSGSLMPEDPKE